MRTSHIALAILFSSLGGCSSCENRASHPHPTTAASADSTSRTLDLLTAKDDKPAAQVLPNPLDTTIFSGSYDSTLIHLGLVDKWGTLRPFAVRDTQGYWNPSWIEPFSDEDTVPMPNVALPRSWTVFKGDNQSPPESLILVSAGLFPQCCQRNWAFYTTFSVNQRPDSEPEDQERIAFSIIVDQFTPAEFGEVARTVDSIASRMGFGSNTEQGEQGRHFEIVAAFRVHTDTVCVASQYVYEGFEDILFILNGKQLKRVIRRDAGAC